MRTVVIVESSGALTVERYERTYSDGGTPQDRRTGWSQFPSWAVALQRRKPWTQPGPVIVVPRWRA